MGNALQTECMQTDANQKQVLQINNTPTDRTKQFMIVLHAMNVQPYCRKCQNARNLIVTVVNTKKNWLRFRQ